MRQPLSPARLCNGWVPRRPACPPCALLEADGQPMQQAEAGAARVLCLPQMCVRVAPAALERRVHLREHSISAGARSTVRTTSPLSGSGVLSGLVRSVLLLSGNIGKRSPHGVTGCLSSWVGAAAGVGTPSCGSGASACRQLCSSRLRSMTQYTSAGPDARTLSQTLAVLAMSSTADRACWELVEAVLAYAPGLAKERYIAVLPTVPAGGSTTTAERTARCAGPRALASWRGPDVPGSPLIASRRIPPRYPL